MKDRYDMERIEKLTAAEFVTKYPQAKINKEHLEDWACPMCGNRRYFIVQITTQMELWDTWMDNQIGDNEFAGPSYARCPICHTEGVTWDFQIKGLDVFLKELKEAVE